MNQDCTESVRLLLTPVQVSQRTGLREAAQQITVSLKLMVTWPEIRGARSLIRADLAQRPCGGIKQQCPEKYLSQTDTLSLRLERKMLLMGPDDNRSLWMLQM